MIVLKQLHMKNFLSVGNKEQVVDLDGSLLCLVLGENRDVGMEKGSRNGAGKTTILQALCFALYGESLTNIKKDNLINKTNKKNMFVALDFEKNGQKYRIERGRRPNFLNFYVEGKKMELSDESEGDSRNTQMTIEKILGMSKELFKQIVGLNTFTLPFLSMPLAMQRTVIEELLGISSLSEKAEILKEKIKETKSAIGEEEVRIETLKKTNDNIMKTVEDLKRKRKNWEETKNRKLKQMIAILEEMKKVDIEREIENHKKKEELKKIEREIAETEKFVSMKTKRIQTIEKEIASIQSKLSIMMKERICPLCKQRMTDEHAKEAHKEMEIKLASLEDEKNTLETEMNNYVQHLEKLKLMKKNIGIVETFYKNAEEAYNHKAILENTTNEIEKLTNEKDPYSEQIVHLEKHGLQEIDYERLNHLKSLLEHQKLLLKFLTKRDSFIRRKIIEQSIAFLNRRLKYYTKLLRLNHVVEFQPDLEVSIREASIEYDYDNLSRGERTRVMLALSMAFRDIFEMLNAPLNLIFVDEVIDNGLDQLGVENALTLFETISKNHRKNVFIISHREELLNRVDNVIWVIKENGFTTIN